MSLNEAFTFPSIWNVPYRRNSYFTGREEIFTQLRKALTTRQVAALTQPQAISGLGGIGKTQTAIEYAYRFAKEYQAVLWIKGDSNDTLISDFVSIAGLLHLSQKAEMEQGHIINAVKRWLERHTGWLLILDNVEEIALVKNFIPAITRGHVLLTTRAKAMGRIAQRIELEKMQPDEGALFLLRWANIIAPHATLSEVSASDYTKAREISEIMDGLPLALDQAGAYIEETACGLSGYLNLYRKRSMSLLKERGKLASDHPEAVTTIWSNSLEKVQQANPAAAELIQLCTFLYPDMIPEEIIIEGSTELGPILQPVAEDQIELNVAIGELLKFSLIQRSPDGGNLALHRLVQFVLKERMNKETQRLWAERAVRAVNRALPDIELATWQQHQRYLPQFQFCKTLIEQWKMVFPEAAQLLYQAGYYFKLHGQYAQSEQFFSAALMIYQQIREPDDSDVIACFDNLAILFQKQGKSVEAETLYRRILEMSETVLGPEHPNLVPTLNNLGSLYQERSKYAEAEALYQRTLLIDQKTWGLDHPNVAVDLSNLARLYQAKSEHSRAEEFSQQALEIWEQLLGSDRILLLSGLESYALFLRKVNREIEAEGLENFAQTLRATHNQENPLPG